jgi:DNA polymerase elongation subunit (family B)
LSLFPTNVRKYGKELLVKEVHNGKRTRMKVPYKPYLFVQAKPDTEALHFTAWNKPVSKIDFESMREAKEFVENYKDVSGFEWHGLDDFQYVFMNDNYSGEFDPDHINIVSLDIETMSDDGFPEPEKADKEFTAITMSLRGEFVVIGNGNYVPHRPNVRYIKCDSEALLLQTFVEEFAKLDADIVTGWNVDRFDMTYLVNRIIRILDEKWASRLSPWGIIQARTKRDVEKNEYEGYDIYGIEVLDYLDLYKKWTFVKRETYRLEFIAKAEELESGKLDYKELGYKDLHDLYTRNYQLYVEYNIQDTEVINLLEEKLKLIALVQAVAYQAKINYTDTFSPVKTWDVIIHNFLMARNQVVPRKKVSLRSDEFAGGFVKEPIPRMYEWVVSEDLDSLYPHNIMQNNISPEMYRGKLDMPSLTVDAIVDGALDNPHVQNYLKTNNLAIAPNRTLWDRSSQGFLAELMEKFYAERKEFKKMSIENKKLYEKTQDPKYKKLSVLYDTIQLARKVLLNSAYGALANTYFRWYNIDYAEAVTTTGQLVIQVTSREVNKYFNKILGTTDVDYIIANDTDSMYIEFKGIVDKFCEGKTKHETVDFIDKMCKEALEPYLTKVFEGIAVYTNAYAQKMNMKREAISDRGIWTGKKRYILNIYDLEGVRFETPKLKFTGLEVVRSTTPAVCREKIRDAFKVVMNGTNDDLIEYIDAFRKEFYEMPFDKVARNSGVRGMEKYYDRHDRWKSGAPTHVKGALIYNELIEQRKLQKVLPKLRDGDKIRYATLKQPNPTFDKVISCPGELPPEMADLAQYIDYSAQFEKTFLAPMANILNVIGWDTEHRATLDCF